MKHGDWFAIFGILAVGMYVFTVVFGGMVYPDYSHVSQAISELVGSYAPTRNLLNPLFLIYNVLVVVFAAGVYKKWNNTKIRIGAVLLFILGAASILMWWFPMDSKGYPVTQLGVIHIVLASIESLATVLATFLFGLGLKKVLPVFARFSFVTGILLLITGPIAGIAAASNNPYTGVAERITIGIFMLWLLVFSSCLWKFPKCFGAHQNE